MRPKLGSGLLLCIFAAVLGSSSTAQAWTRTVVKGAKATVDLERDATLNILLRLDVEVHAGWLHELDLVDLGDGVELDRYRPPYFRSEEGEIFRPQAEVLDDGRIHLSFPRREAPRQGEYRVFMRYRIQADVHAVEDTDQARVVWSVPAWETGLHGVSVQIRAPKGSSVPSDLHDTPPGVEFQVAEHPERTVVEWRRIHLPRLTAWPLTLDVPLRAIDLPVSAPDAPTPAGFRPLSTPDKRPIAWTLLLVAILVLLKRRAVQVRMGPDAFLVRLPWVVVLAVSGIVVVIGQWLGTELPSVRRTSHRLRTAPSGPLDRCPRAPRLAPRARERASAHRNPSERAARWDQHDRARAPSCERQRSDRSRRSNRRASPPPRLPDGDAIPHAGDRFAGSRRAPPIRIGAERAGRSTGDIVLLGAVVRRDASAPRPPTDRPEPGSPR